MPDVDHRQHEQWLLELTAIPTAAGREHRVIAWVERWLAARPSLKLRRDTAGNLVITPGRGGGKRRPLFITAHLDHPAFVVAQIHSERRIDLEFRGGVLPPYFENAAINIFDDQDQPHHAEVIELDADARPFKRVTAVLNEASQSLRLGDIGRWALEREDLPHVSNGVLYTHACDDLAAVAAALATLDHLQGMRGAGHVGVLLTRAEEVGFIGAIHAATKRSVPKSARLICLENSRSFPESPVGAGPIVRVGDRLSVFHPELTNRLAAIMVEHVKSNPQFKWQRKLMPGGACEATAFSSFGYESTCVCLPLGNYHNMIDIDGVQAGQRPARVGPEYISLEDYHGMIQLLIVCAMQLDAAQIQPLDKWMRSLLKDNGHVLDDPPSVEA
jgi:endoglucanase